MRNAKQSEEPFRFFLLLTSETFLVKRGQAVHFSIRAFPSSVTLFALAEISPAFATLAKST
jgi:hypothetical protein